jgi:hypothetical protein
MIDGTFFANKISALFSIATTMSRRRSCIV